MPDFLPRRDAELAVFAGVFARRLEADGAAYGIRPQTVAECTRAAAAFEAAHGAASGAGRSVSTVLVKNQRRAELERVLRAISAIARSGVDVDDAMLVSLGLRPRRSDFSRRAKPIPDEPPRLSILRMEGSTFTFHVSPAVTSGRGGMPRAARGAMIETCVSETPPVDALAWRPAIRTMQSRLTATFGDRVEPGKRVWFRARYLDKRDRPGPWSDMIHRRVADSSMFATPLPVQAAFLMKRVA